MPRRGSFKTLFDSMQLEACGIVGPAELDAWKPPTGAAPTGKSIFVDATKGSDSAAGTAAAPLQTIGAAVAKATAHMTQSTADAAAKATVVLKAGVYHGCDGKGNVCALGAAQSGLTITSAPGEDATITGGEPLAITAADWKRVPTKAPSGGTRWKDMPNMNDVASRAGMPTPGSDTKCCKFLGVMQTDTLDACKAAAVAAGGNFAGVTCEFSNRLVFITPSSDANRCCHQTTPPPSVHHTAGTATASTKATGSSRQARPASTPRRI